MMCWTHLYDSVIYNCEERLVDPFKFFEEALGTSEPNLLKQHRHQGAFDNKWVQYLVKTLKPVIIEPARYDRKQVSPIGGIPAGKFPIDEVHFISSLPF